MWRAFLEIPRCCEMKGACHLTLLGSDGAQLLLKIWDRLPLWDLQGFLYLAVGLHHSWVLMLNPRVLWGSIKDTHIIIMCKQANFAGAASNANVTLWLSMLFFLRLWCWIMQLISCIVGLYLARSSKWQRKRLRINKKCHLKLPVEPFYVRLLYFCSL